MSDWQRFFQFLERRARRLPRPLSAPARRAHKLCAERFLEEANPAIDQIEPELRREAQLFLQSLYLRRPAGFRERLLADLTRFVELAPMLFGDDSHRDLLQLNEAVKLFNRYDRSEPAYIFLVGLPARTPEPIRSQLEGHRAYQSLLRAGAVAMRKFFFELRIECRITTRDLTDDAAQNLAQELGETELTLRVQIDELERRVGQLETELGRVRQEAADEGFFQLVQRLQGRPVPVLDQLDQVCRRLQALDQPDSDQLTVLIALEDTIQTFAELGLERYPPQRESPFALSQHQFSEYLYVSGRPFDGEGTRTVRCVAPGWRLRGRVVTPARVAEIEEGSLPS